MRPRSVAEFGSPPQVRGKRRDAWTYTCSVGITPAGAGKTDVEDTFFTDDGDHPRRCGENQMTAQ